MVSFQSRLTSGLIARGLEVGYRLDEAGYEAVLVTGGTRDLAGLWRARRQGIPVVQRLDGMNWLHRKLRTGLRHFLRAEYGNLVLGLIRDRLATRIVYQSEFSRCWWERARGTTPVDWRVVYNAVDLAVFTPDGSHTRPGGYFRLLMVEGNLGGGYEFGLEYAVKLAQGVASSLPCEKKGAVELVVVGRVAPQVQSHWQEISGVPLVFTGVVPAEHIPEIDRSAHLLYAADINAACPNATIEALACGLPVVAFDTGALAELVQGDAGRIVPYGGDPWKLEEPDVGALVQAAVEVLNDQERFRSAAHAHAQVHFGLERMVTGYLDALES